MTLPAPDPAEEFYSTRRENAVWLEQGARARAAQGDAALAFLLAWGADLEAWQAALWERLVVVSGDTPREFFQGALPVFTGPAGGGRGSDDAEQALRAARQRLLDGLDPSLQRGLSDAWPDSSYLAGLPAPTAASLREPGLQRLSGLTPAEYAAGRRASAKEAMLQAHSQRIAGDIPAAIRSAYAADFAALDAYLVDSAVSAGDADLLTVETRREVVARSVAALPGLPPDFAAAVDTLRAAMARPLGDADGRRFAATLPTV